MISCCQKDCIHESILLIALLLSYCIATYITFSYMTILDYFHILGNVPETG